MSKGTAAQGKRQKQTHLICRKCGKHAYHMRKKRCSSCGFGASSKNRKYSWAKNHQNYNQKFNLKLYEKDKSPFVCDNMSRINVWNSWHPR